MLNARAHRSEWVPLSPTGAGYEFLVASGEAIESHDPATSEVVAVVRSSTDGDVDEAVGRAREAVDRSPHTWARDGARRSAILQKFSVSLRRSQDHLAELLTREQGKPIHDARTEVNKAAGLFEYYGGLCRGVEGRVLSVSEHADAVVVREPLGVVAIIVPWNAPLILLARALAPALAAGNACVIKPASLTPGVSIEALTMLASDPDLPPGVLNCVCGSGDSVGDALVGHDGVDMISFTGGSTTGSAVMKRAADGLKKVCLELGGKSPNVVFADAPFDKAVAGAQEAIFAEAGQNCTAGSRLLLENSVYEPFLDSLVASAAQMRIGDGLDPATDMGPLVSRHQKDVVLEYLAIAQDEGTILLGGKETKVPGYEKGFFVAPTIVTDVPPNSRLVREEIFGPLLTVQRFTSEEEAVELANDTRFGLAAGLWTRDLDRCLRVARLLKGGTVWINTYHHYYPEAEGGGFKTSGIGRQQGITGLLEYTQTKHLNFDTARTLW